jgi:hypothetical protein
MLLLENLDGYGLLITLLAESFRDSVPFLVFSGVWLCVFCVLFRSLGSMPHISGAGCTADQLNPLLSESESKKWQE